MKQIRFITIAVTIVCMTIATTVFATESTPSALPSKEASDSSRQKQIDNLKERLATKVAELRQTQKRAISGTVKNTSITTITIETNTKDVKIERNDDIQVYQMLKGKRTKLSTDDVEKGDFIVVFGDYDTTLDILKAKVIFIQSLPLLRIWGSIKDIDKNNFTVTITTKEEREIVIDIEKSTKVTLWTKSQGVEKSGFSKLATFDVIHILGSAVPKKENRISAGRILSLGNLTNPSITPTSTPEIGASPTLP